MLFLTLLRPKFKYASIDAKKLARIQRKFVALYQSRSFTYDQVTCEDFLKCLQLHNPHERRLHLEALFFNSVRLILKCCPPLSDFTGIQVLFRHFRNSSLFTVTFKTLRLLDVFRLLALCIGTSTSFGNPLLPLKSPAFL
jgi:hypothetical protein